MLEAASLSFFLGGAVGFLCIWTSLEFIRWPYSLPIGIALAIFWLGVIEVTVL